MVMNQDIQWNVEKDAWLQGMRGLSFNMAEEAIAGDEIVDDFQHPKKAHQRIMVFRVGGRCVAVPYVSQEDGRFLKTMYFSRDLDKKYGVENG
jgi:hypothetical protein